jgi:hypothetical protein
LHPVSDHQFQPPHATGNTNTTATPVVGPARPPPYPRPRASAHSRHCTRLIWTGPLLNGTLSMPAPIACETCTATFLVGLRTFRDEAATMALACYAVSAGWSNYGKHALPGQIVTFVRASLFPLDLDVLQQISRNCCMGVMPTPRIFASKASTKEKLEEMVILDTLKQS